MRKMPIALQLYSVRDEMDTDFEGTLRKVKNMGYEGVEFAGLHGHNAAELKKLLKELNLVPVSAHVPFEEMMNDSEKVLGTYAELGCKYVAVPYVTEEYRPGQEGFSRIIEAIRVLGKTARDKGMILLYHNHDFEFAKVNGEYGLDVLYSSVPADLLQTEIDTCWVNVAGENPTEYVKKYSGRTPVIHLKDFVMKNRNKPAHLYQLIGIESDEADKAGEENFGFRPVGYGVQDIPSIIEAANASGAQWLVVEQDEPSMGKTSMESAQMSINYLRKLNV